MNCGVACPSHPRKCNGPAPEFGVVRICPVKSGLQFKIFRFSSDCLEVVVRKSGLSARVSELNIPLKLCPLEGSEVV